MGHIEKNKLRFIRTISWEEVFGFWRENEAKQSDWMSYYEGKGFESWDEWRKVYADRFGCDKLSWGLYEVTDAKERILHFYGGPFEGWIKNYYKGRNIRRFSTLLKFGEIKNNAKIGQIANSFPKKTTMIGLFVDGKIVVIEGMHRCCALALMNEKMKSFDGIVFMALAKYSHKKFPSGYHLK